VSEAVTTPSRSERTRSALLREAERLFASKGFDGTRLEDVAEAVGIRRASIVYHYRDKRELYDAVLEGLFGDFLARLEPFLAEEGRVSTLMEGAVDAWVTYIAERPALPRLLLREFVDSDATDRPRLLTHIEPYTARIERFVESRAAARGGSELDPAHVACAIAGATLFFAVALPGLGTGTDTHDLEHHRREVLKLAGRLLAAPGDAT